MKMVGVAGLEPAKSLRPRAYQARALTN